MVGAPGIADITTLVLLALLVVLVLSGVLLFRMVAQPERRIASVERALSDLKADVARLSEGMVRVERSVQVIVDAAMNRGLSQ